MIVRQGTLLVQGDWTSGLKLPKRQGVNDLIHQEQRTVMTSPTIATRKAIGDNALRPALPEGRI